MSVIVKGMKMPENCEECFFVGRGFPDWCGIPWIPKDEDEIEDTSIRPDWCPLVELPEKHGGLIDGNAFREELDNHYPFTKEEQSRHGMADIAKGELLYVLNKMPIVIEAEGEE